MTAGPWPIAWSGTARYRSPVISVGEALRAVLDATPVLGTERVLPLREAAGGEAPYFSMILVQGKA